MKLKTATVFALGAFSALAFSVAAQHAGPAQELANFTIELEVLRAENGVRMKCTQGCAWKTLSFSCETHAGDCQGSFDQHGTPAH